MAVVVGIFVIIGIDDGGGGDIEVVMMMGVDLGVVNAGDPRL